MKLKIAKLFLDHVIRVMTVVVYRVSWGECQLGDLNLSDFLGTIFILIHFYLMKATNEHYFLIIFIQ